MDERTQHRTGHSIVRLGNPAWTVGVTGRWHLHLEVTTDQMSADWLAEGRPAEVERISAAIVAAAREAAEVRPDRADLREGDR